MLRIYISYSYSRLSTRNVSWWYRIVVSMFGFDPTDQSSNLCITLSFLLVCVWCDVSLCIALYRFASLRLLAVFAPLAQLDRASDFESGGLRFDPAVVLSFFFVCGVRAISPLAHPLTPHHPHFSNIYTLINIPDFNKICFDTVWCLMHTYRLTLIPLGLAHLVEHKTVIFTYCRNLRVQSSILWAQTLLLCVVFVLLLRCMLIHFLL